MRYVFSILVVLLSVAAPTIAQQCPCVAIIGPTYVKSENARDGIKLKANIGNAPANVELRYRWNVSVGTITSGIDTGDIGLDTAYLGGQTITITLETSLSDNSCKSKTQHTVEIEQPPPICGMPFDQYGDIRWEDEQARLDNFAIQITNLPTARGLLTIFAGERTYKDEANLRLMRAKNYLVNVRQVDPNRLILIDGGYDSEFNTILTVVPDGATIPYYSYGVSIPKDKIKFTKRRPKDVRPW